MAPNTLIPMKVNADKTLTVFVTGVAAPQYVSQIRTLNALTSDSLKAGQIVKVPYSMLNGYVRDMIDKTRSEMMFKKYAIPALAGIVGLGAFFYYKHNKKRLA